MIPEGWKKCELGQACEFQRGFDLPSGKRTPGTVPVISSSGVSGYHDVPMAYPPGLVTGRYGTIGTLYFVEEPFWPLNTALWVKNLHGNDARFFYHLLSRFDFKKFSDKTGVPGVNRNDLHAVQVLVPPFDEQRRIAEILSTWDRAIEATEKLIANSQAQKKALMQQLLTGKKRLPGFSGAWREIPLTEAAKVSTGSSNREDSDLEGPYTFFDRSTDIRRSERYIFDCEAVIVGGEGQEFIPKYFEGKFDLHQRAYVIHDFDGWCPKFIFYTVHHNRHLLLRYAVGSTVASLRMGSFTKVPVRTIPLAEQKMISTVLWRADEEIALQKAGLTTLQAQKSALMRQLLTGKRRVKLPSAQEEAA